MRYRPPIRVLCLVATVFALAPLRPATADHAPPDHSLERCAVVDIDHVGSEALAALKATPGVDWWLELGGELMVCGNNEAITGIAAHHPLRGIHDGLDPSELRLALVLGPSELAELGATTLARGGRAALVRMDAAALGRWQETRNALRGEIKAVVPNTVVARQLANEPPRPRPASRPKAIGLVDMIDMDRWFANISTLASWSRNTHGSEILLARDWLVGQFEAMPGLSVTTPSFTVPPATTAFNVMAVLPGHTRPDDWYVVGGHYDSMPSSGPAPGAEDNASGCAGVLELAHIFTVSRSEATIIFICYAGEEQWLYGSYDHVDTLIADGDDDKVRGMLDMDMIGFTGDAALDAIIESYAFASSFYTAFTDAAMTYAPELDLTLVTHVNSVCCSDHMPYLEDGIPAVLTIDDYTEYSGIYHTADDTPDKIVPAMGEQILRMNVAAMAELAGVADTSLFGDDFETGNTAAWSATEPPPPILMRAIKGKR